MRSAVPRHVTDTLAAVPLFSDSTIAELRSIASLGTPLQVEAGRTLTTQGRPGSEFFLVMSGTASCAIDGETVAEFAAGDYFGELALLSQAPRSATVTAETDMDVIVLDAREFSSLLDNSGPVTRRMLGRLAARVSALEDAAAA